ncbi:MAG: MBOAT family protein, partial [Planctomycetota bacterium]
MGFVRLEFPIFLIVVVLLAWSTRRVRFRNGVLLAASYYFYAYWDFRFCGLLMLSTVVDFIVAQRIQRSTEAKIRRRWLMLSLFVKLGTLALFKYFDFFIGSAQAILSPLGINTQTLNLILPVGISFYTFQTLSYTIDVYRRKLAPTDRWIDF